MILDLTLNALKFPGLENYTPPFGTKKSDNVGLTTLEGCNNLAKPFADQRPLTISENSSFSADIERNATIEIDTASVTLTLDDATFIGCRLSVIATFSTGTASVLFGATTYTINAGQKLEFVYDGTTWIIDGDITATAVTVATTDWTDESDGGATPTYADYPWAAEITLTGVTTAHSPDVRFDLTDATSGIFAPVAGTAAGKVLIYASEQPSAAITIPVIICKKVV